MPRAVPEAIKRGLRRSHQVWPTRGTVEPVEVECRAAAQPRQVDTAATAAVVWSLSATRQLLCALRQPCALVCTRWSSFWRSVHVHGKFPLVSRRSTISPSLVVAVAVRTKETPLAVVVAVLVECSTERD